MGKHAAGKLPDDDFIAIEKKACPSVGSCGGMFTANTMSSAFEALGMSLPGSSTMAAPDEEKAHSAAESARVLLGAIKRGLRPRDIMSKEAFENAIAVVMAVGGSTNAVLHLMAIAREAEVNLTLADFEKVRARTPVICDLKPSGRYVTVDLHRVGGIPQVMKILLNGGLLHGDCMTISGRTIAETLADVADEPPPAQEVIHSLARPDLCRWSFGGIVWQFGGGRQCRKNFRRQKPLSHWAGAGVRFGRGGIVGDFGKRHQSGRCGGHSL